MTACAPRSSTNTPRDALTYASRSHSQLPWKMPGWCPRCQLRIEIQHVDSTAQVSPLAAIGRQHGNPRKAWSPTTWIGCPRQDSNLRHTV